VCGRVWVLQLQQKEEEEVPISRGATRSARACCFYCWRLCLRALLVGILDRKVQHALVC